MRVPSFLQPRYVSRFRLPLGLLVFTIAYGSVGYRALEGWSWLDSVYMTMITLTTVGYREVQPLDGSGQVFTISLLALGVITLLSAVSVGTEMLASGEVANALWRRRVRKRLGALSEHVVICGFGHVGRAADDYARERVPFAIVDTAPEIGAEDVPHDMGDVTDENALRAAGIEQARALLCAVDSDSVNVHVTLTARALNPDLIIVARASSPKSVDVLHRTGADRVVSPFVLGGRQMASLSLRPSVVDFIDSVTVAPGSVWRRPHVACSALRRVRIACPTRLPAEGASAPEMPSAASSRRSDDDQSFPWRPVAVLFVAIVLLVATVITLSFLVARLVTGQAY